MKMDMRTRFRTVALTTSFATLLGLTGLSCGPMVEPVDTNHGLLSLKFVGDTVYDDPSIHPFHQHIPAHTFRAGSSVDVEIESFFIREPVGILSLSVDDEQVMMTTITDDAEFRIDFFEAGEATLDMRVEMSDGEIFTDTFDFVVGPAQSVLTGHPCDRGADHGAYLVDSDIRIGYFYFDDEDDRPLTGYGNHPIEVDGSAQLTFDEASSDLLYWSFHTGSDVGEAQISSTLDDSVLTMDIVDADAIDGVRLVDPQALEELEVGRDEASYFVPTAGDLPLCFASVDFYVQPLTPDVCTAFSSFRAPTGQAFRDNRLRITRRAEGECQIELSFPDLNGGEGLTEILTLWGSQE
jgi:hypothetical protein